MIAESNAEGIMVRFSGHTEVFVGSTYTLTSSMSTQKVPVMISDEQSLEQQMNEKKFAMKAPSVDGVGLMTTSYDSLFTVTDPGGFANKGDNVNFTNSYSYSAYGGIDAIQSYQYLY